MLDDDDGFFDDVLMRTIDNIDNGATRSSRTLSFNCSGEDIECSAFSNDGFIKSKDAKFLSYDNHVHSFELFDVKISDSTLLDPATLASLMSKARMNVQILTVASRTNLKENTKPFFDIRMQVTKLLITIRNLVGENLFDCKILKPVLKSLRNLFDHQLTFAHLNFVSQLGGKSGNSQIELTSLRGTQFEQELCALIRDLIHLSSCRYNKCKSSEIILQLPFECMCVKEMWLMLQLLVEELERHDQIDPFWMYFNECLDQLQDYAGSDRNLQLKDHIEFSAWLLNGVSKLYGYSENGIYVGVLNIRSADNYDYLENVTRMFLNSDPLEEPLRIYMCLTIPLIHEC
ncbi:Protein MMS22-like [Pseudolycoriella hygida]|uniref:Protein MMS22-like n=1 Tax=Pseudolycoriella hygida TaxID=35572 RepID=A0A9Q0N3N3_9DIPT|nr:Protein MMS22-like [Pseudolycoriella hygida]